MVFVLVQVLGAPSNSAPLPAQEHDSVWVWTSRCQRPMQIGVRVRLDAQIIYTRTIPICRAERGLADGRLTFRFTSPRALVWFGYRSDPDSGRDVGDTTATTTPIEVNFWQAGGAADHIELGLSAAAPDGLHMNTVHILLPTSRSETAVATGLVLETWPIGRPAGSRRAGS